MISRPADNEHAPSYATYISKVPDGDLLNFMELQPDQFNGLINDLTDEQAIEPPAPGKWSVKQVLGHLCDTERIMGYRALRFARADKTEIEGFEQDDYVAAANSNARSATELLAELKSVRGATLSLLESLTTAESERSGMANGKSISVRALAYVIAGHAQHHLELLRKQLAG
ncbi:MAG TPA: DinB family protein [Terriglobales bacterium]